jgi:hypothetical protein
MEDKPMYNQQGFQGGQQGFQGSQQSSFAQGNRYQPTGYAQSQYQGQTGLSGFQNQTTRPVISHIGSQGGAPLGVNTTGYDGQTNGGDRASFGPVISHVGYEAGQDFSSGIQGGQNYTSQFGGGASQSQGGYGSQSGSYGSQTGGYGSQMGGYGSQSGGYGSQMSSYGSQSGYQNQPVIAQVGYTAGSGSERPVINALGSTANSYYTPSAGYGMGMGPSGYGQGQSGLGQGGYTQNTQSSFQSGFGQNAQTPDNPVYRATNARQQDGPVIQQVGYQAGYQGNSRGGSGAL